MPSEPIVSHLHLDMLTPEGWIEVEPRGIMGLSYSPDSIGKEQKVPAGSGWQTFRWRYEPPLPPADAR